MDTRNTLRSARLSLVACALTASCGHAFGAEEPAKVGLVESYPSALTSALEIYQEQVTTFAAASGIPGPSYVIVPKLQRWTPGQIVRVGFNGGTDDLRKKIRTIAETWIKKSGANLTFEFHDPAGKFLAWSAVDKIYVADIRIGFLTGRDFGGYWSAVGNNSVNAALGYAPNAASMNFEGFDKELPMGWEAVVLHEFGHALGFHHEHQMPVGGCDFRFYDDAGYVATKNAQGWFAEDLQGRRPGAYTYLGGFANYWDVPKVDRNLRSLASSSAFLVSGFDKDSIMKYYFPEIILVAGSQSHCYTPYDNAVLSLRDLEGARRVYPKDAKSVSDINAEVEGILLKLRASPVLLPALREQASERLHKEFGK